MRRADRRNIVGRTGLRALLAAGALCLVLGLPNHPAALTPETLLILPLELPILLLLLALLPPGRPLTTVVRAGIVVVLTSMTLQKLADFAMFPAYNRGFNPLFDLHLLPAAWNLGSEALGTLLAGGVLLALVTGIGLLAWGLWWATGQWARLVLPAARRPWRAVGAALLVPLTALAVAETGAALRHWSLPFDIPGTAFTTRVAVERAGMIAETLARLETFRTAAAVDPYADRAPLLDHIGHRDVLVTFIESYGATSLTNPRYAPTHSATLAAIEADLRARGLAMRSGWLEAPISGGQSWMSHATLATGLWVPDQPTYSAALLSERKSLFDLARRNGFETAAVMPAITMEWPEAAFMGFDRVYTAGDLGYGGLPFNWVTMPDQFTLRALERLLLEGRDRAPVFAQVALISSHAPWTPVPDLVAWEDIGDGRIFEAVAQSGDPPAVVWRDRDRVRDQFRQAIDYSLRTVGAFAARWAEARPFLIVLGDHQPARFVAEDDSLNVPIHVIGPQALVERLADWDWSRGMIPGSGVPVLRMDAFRDRFLATFSSAGPGD